MADLLGTAYADGRLTLAEFNERTDAVWSSKTLGDLNPLTADLGGSPALIAPTAGGATIRVDDVQPIHTYAILSSRKQPDNWVVPDTMSALAFMGSAEYDFRTATFVSPRVTINVGVLMGSITLLIPDGVSVVDKSACIMGSVEFKGMTPAQPGAPVIELRGFVCMGSIEVKGANFATFLQRLGLKPTD